MSASSSQYGSGVAPVGHVSHLAAEYLRALPFAIEPGLWLAVLLALAACVVAARDTEVSKHAPAVLRSPNQPRLSVIVRTTTSATVKNLDEKAASSRRYRIPIIPCTVISLFFFCLHFDDGFARC